MGFINFHSHSEYSFLASLLKIDEIVQFSLSGGFEGCAVTDTLSTYGFIELSRTCLKNKIKPVFGCELFIKGSGGKGHYPVLLIALDRRGLENIYLLNSFAHKLYLSEHIYTLPQEVLFSHYEGLAVLAESEIYFNRKNKTRALKIVSLYQDVFKENFFVEVNYTGEKKVPLLKEIVDLIEANRFPALAACEARYSRYDGDAFPALNAYREKKEAGNEKGLPLDTGFDFSLKTKDDFSHYFKNHPQYLANAESLFARIEDNIIKKSFPVPHYIKSLSRLRKICERKLNAYCSDSLYRIRLEEELGIIEKEGISDYFIFAYDIACFIKINKIPYGFGKGSLPSSLVLFLLGLTKIDPVEHGLLFELFVPPGLPFSYEIELDISRKKKGAVFSYVHSKFGKKNVSFLSVIDRWTIRSAFRAVSKYSRLDRDSAKILSSFFNRSNFSIEEELNADSRFAFLYNENKELKECSDTVRRLDGKACQNQVQSDCFTVIPGGLEKQASLDYNAGGEPFAELTRDDGRISPFLRVVLNSNRSVAIIEETMRTAKLKDINYNDGETYLLLSEGRTAGIFTLESPGIREFIKKAQIDSLSCLCDIITLYRKDPLTLGTASDYITRRINNLNYGKVSPKAHETNPITWETYGLILYEEQVLRIIHEAAGVELDKSILFLQALLKKNNPAVLSFKKQFIKGCVQNGSDKEFAQRLFGILLEVGRWAVKKSHTLNYAYLAYAGAYLKTHHPLEFYLSYLNNNLDLSENLNKIIMDIRFYSWNINILPININKSRCLFSLENGNIRAGLYLINHLGQETARNIVRERNKNGMFKDMLDFTLRMSSFDLHEKALENLIKAGAFSESDRSVSELLSTAHSVYKFARKEEKDEENSLFERGEQIPDLEYFIRKNPPADMPVNSMDEFEATDVFLTHDPLDRVKDVLGRYSVDETDQMQNLEKGTFIAYLFQLRAARSRRGGMTASAQICDRKGIARAVFFPSVYQRYSSILQNHTIYLMKGKINNNQLIVEQIFLFDELIKNG